MADIFARYVENPNYFSNLPFNCLTAIADQDLNRPD